MTDNPTLSHIKTVMAITETLFQPQSWREMGGDRARKFVRNVGKDKGE